MFDRVQIPDEQKLSNNRNISEEEKPKQKRLAQRLSKTQGGNASKAFEKENKPNKASKQENKPRRSMPSKQAKSKAGRVIKPTLKVRDDNLIYILVIQLASILKRDWEEKANVVTFIVFCKKQDHKLANSTLEAEIDLFQILGTSI